MDYASLLQGKVDKYSTPSHSDAILNARRHARSYAGHYLL